jgi:hypothetical protein
MDLTPLVADPSLEVASYTRSLIDRMRDDVADRIARMSWERVGHRPLGARGS